MLLKILLTIKINKIVQIYQRVMLGIQVCW